VVYSRCLGGEAVRYDGAPLHAELIDSLRPYATLVPVCPELEMGLGVPRPPIRLEFAGGSRLVRPEDQRDLTDLAAHFKEQWLKAAGAVDGFVLKSRSPSCGLDDVKRFSGNTGRRLKGTTAGFFGGAILEHFPSCAILDEARLTDPALRHHFLTKLFLRARFRALCGTPSLAGLGAFHRAHELLLVAYHATARSLGRLVAEAAKRPLAQVLAQYEKLLSQALAHPARPRAHANVLVHCLGSFQEKLTAREKRQFLGTLEAYLKDRAPLQSPLAVLRNWIERFKVLALAGQTYFDPYPEGLVVLGVNDRVNPLNLDRGRRTTKQRG
jgi:uncharacterized protein YbgA (DUF1722 family)/uncharacterized protein YbbK (DUF523 family)